MLLKNQLEKHGIWLFRFRGTLPLIALIFGLYEYLQTVFHPELYPIKGTRYEVYYVVFCLLVSLLGLYVRAITVGHTPANTSGRNVKEQVADKLNTTGMYSIVRNPLYLGNALMWLGIAMLTMNLWFILSFVFLYWLYYERIIYTEEQFLTRKFGQVYEDWAATTPCFLPRCSGYRKAELPFSWKKVLKKEKNGLLALLLVFSLFDVLGQYLIGQPPKYMPLLYDQGAMLVVYLILKYLKKRTTVLNETGR